MIDSLVNLVFRCPHRRLTRPITPMSKPGVPAGETYVVCLDCGKQFTYDWQAMRIGKPVAVSPTLGVLPPGLPKPPKTKVKYALLGSALPLAFLIGKALLSKPRHRSGRKPPGEEPGPGA